MGDKALTEALHAASRGWFVFPIKGVQKAPPLLTDWEGKASCDPQQIETWSAKWPGCNWGLACGKSHLMVLDVDPKNGGPAALINLEETHEWLPDTLTASTPSGGSHEYYRGFGPSTAGRLGPGLDTRSSGGYVVLPGSRTDAGEYKWTKRQPLASLPEWLGKVLGEVRKPDALRDVPLVELDTELAVRRAEKFLKTAEPAIANGTGDNTTFRTFCHLRDLGVSENRALELAVSTGWNSRCRPPWDYDDLEIKARNAYQYAAKRAGNRDPRAAFDPLPDPSGVPTFKLIRLDTVMEEHIPPRRWVIQDRFLRGYVTVTIAPGGTGKTILSMMEACSIASGRSLTGKRICERGPVWVYNAEDPQDELDRMSLACAKFHGLTTSERKNVFTWSGRRDPLRLLAYGDRGVVVENHALIEKIIQTIRQEGVIALFLDPFVKLHALNENDNVDIDRVAQALSYIAEAADCAVGISHHSRKRSGGSTGVGDAESSRGASSLIAHARVAHTLAAMSVKDAKECGIDANRAPWYVRLDDAKHNLSAPGASLTWFRRGSITIAGDSCGVLERCEFARSMLSEDLTDEERDLATKLETHYVQPITLYAMSMILAESYTDLGSRNTIRKRIEDLVGESGLTTKLGTLMKGPARLIGKAEPRTLLYRINTDGSLDINENDLVYDDFDVEELKKSEDF